jgi:uncharacterized protein (DUF1778 family)
MAARKRSHGPRTQHPRLIGLSEKENALLVRAAARADTTVTEYMRDAALWCAREDLGIKHAAGEA